MIITNEVGMKLGGIAGLMECGSGNQIVFKTQKPAGGRGYKSLELCGGLHFRKSSQLHKNTMLCFLEGKNLGAIRSRMHIRNVMQVIPLYVSVRCVKHFLPSVQALACMLCGFYLSAEGNGEAVQTVKDNPETSAESLI